MANRTDMTFVLWHTAAVTFLVMADCVFLGISNGLLVALSYALVYCVCAPSWINFNSKKSWGAMLGGAFAIALGASINLVFLFPTGDFTVFNIANHDAARTINVATAILNDKPLPYNTLFTGYTWLTAMVWHITGRHILIPLLLNFAFILLAVAMFTKSAIRLFNEAVAQWVPLLCFSICYFSACAMVPYKEPSIYLGVAMALYAVTHKDWKKIVVWATLGALFLATNRLGALYIAGIAVLIISWRKEALVCFVIVGIAYNVFDMQTAANNTFILTNNGIADSYFNGSESHAAYNSMLNGYLDFPLWKRIALLPLTMGAQYIAPFFWTATHNLEFGPSQVVSHCGLPWYLIGGTAMFLFGCKRHFRFMLAIIFCFAALAFLFAGTVSRYALVFTPLVAIAAAKVITIIQEDSRQRQMFIRWGVVYCILLTVALIAAYIISSRDV